MINALAERILARYLALGSLIVTLFVWTATGTDPVNVTKLWLAGGVALASLLIAIRYAGKTLLNQHKAITFISIGFIAAMLNSMLASDAPITQSFFGVYGRNTGFLTYLILAFIFLASIVLRQRKSFNLVLSSLIAAGLVNTIYCGWVILFGDFIPWNNQYQRILGTLGNPDFISAFLGLTIAVTIAKFPDKTISLKYKIVGLIFSILALYEIIKSHAIQGLVVTAGGIALVGFFIVRDRFANKIAPLIYLVVSGFLGLLAILGTFQKGPFDFVYKRSVSLRGSYWHAGIEMGNLNPFSGVGMDAYGDWYRATRPPVALIDTPPVSVVSNVAHNVIIDFFAFGGWPLLISYLCILAVGIISILKVILRTKTYDSTFVGLTVLWSCYQVQSIISINQIGLAIWGWLATGALYAYSRMNLVEETSLKSSAPVGKKKPAQVVSPNLIGGIGLTIGLLIAFPPLNADIKWRNALDSRNLQNLEKALEPTFFNPEDSNKYAQAVVTLRNSNLNDLALKYTLIAIEFNRNNSDFWKLLYTNPVATESQKISALNNAKRLDPRNPDPFGLSQ